MVFHSMPKQVKLEKWFFHPMPKQGKQKMIFWIINIGKAKNGFLSIPKQVKQKIVLTQCLNRESRE